MCDSVEEGARGAADVEEEDDSEEVVVWCVRSADMVTSRAVVAEEGVRAEEPLPVIVEEEAVATVEGAEPSADDRVEELKSSTSLSTNNFLSSYARSAKYDSDCKGVAHAPQSKKALSWR